MLRERLAQAGSSGALSRRWQGLAETAAAKSNPHCCQLQQQVFEWIRGSKEQIVSLPTAAARSGPGSRNWPRCERAELASATVGNGCSTERESNGGQVQRWASATVGNACSAVLSLSLALFLSSSLFLSLSSPSLSFSLPLFLSPSCSPRAESASERRAASALKLPVQLQGGVLQADRPAKPLHAHPFQGSHRLCRRPGRGGDRGAGIDVAGRLPVAAVGAVPRPADFAPVRPLRVRVPGAAPDRPRLPDLSMAADATKHTGNCGRSGAAPGTRTRRAGQARKPLEEHRRRCP
eukprot:9332199-Alexandrium_andersonii.AAC.1